jgi:oxygen-dependent protoporphyrinogen oxidase
MGRPLVSGTWIADDADTSVALLWWTVRNMLVPNVYNLRSGVAALPNALAQGVSPRLSCPVRNVTDTGGGVEVTYADGRAGSVERTESFDACLIATTAQPALAMFPQMDANHRALYETARYRRLGSICLGLSRRPPDPATYFLVPPAEDPDTIAVVADHNKSPGRAPDTKGLLTVLLSHEYLERSEDLSDEQVLDRAIQSVERYHGRLADQVEEHAAVRWAEAVPTIDKGRFRLIAEFTRKLDRRARVQFASDLDRIPGLNGALVSGRQAAGRIGEVLRSVRPHTIPAGSPR